MREPNWYWHFRKFWLDVWHFMSYRLWYDIRLTWDWYWNVLRYDGDWDWSHICLVLKYKLERTRKCLEQGHHLRADRDARQIRLCEMLLDRIEKDDYLINSLYFHDKKWGEMKIKWEPTDNLTLTRAVFTRPNSLTPEQEEQEIKERRLLYKHSDYMAKQDLEYLGKLLTKYLKNWWD